MAQSHSDAVRAGGADADLTRLRDAIARAREAGRATYDRFADATAWAISEVDWPLWALDLPDDVPERRVELLMFDQEVDGPLWDRRTRIATYPQRRCAGSTSGRTIFQCRR